MAPKRCTRPSKAEVQKRMMILSGKLGPDHWEKCVCVVVRDNNPINPMCSPCRQADCDSLDANWEPCHMTGEWASWQLDRGFDRGDR